MHNNNVMSKLSIGLRIAATAGTLALASCQGNGPQTGPSISTHPYTAVPAPHAYVQTNIAVPNVPTTAGSGFWSIDIGLVDSTTGLYYLADKTNKGVDVFDANANTFIKTITGGFVGDTGKSSTSGPNGLVQISATKMYAGDGDGTVKVIDLTGRTVTKTIVIPKAQFRTDEGTYDPIDQIVMIASDAETAGPLLTFINTQTDTVIGQTLRSDATGGMESSLFVPYVGQFAQAVPVTKKNKNGEIDLIDPHTFAITATFPLPNTCGPTGMSLGPNGNLVVACSDPGETYILNISDGSTIAATTQGGGGDETAYDALTGKFFVANSNNTTTGKKGDPAQPSVTVIDANTNVFIQNIPTEGHAHSIATFNGKVFVPRPSIGVAVYR